MILVLALVMLGTLGACKSQDDSGTAGQPSDSGGESPSTSVQPSESAQPSTNPSASATPSASPEPSQSPSPPPAPAVEQTLVVGYNDFSQKFSPFFAKSVSDNDATALTQLTLFGNDRAGNVILNGIKGETIPYNGVDYTYTGPADVSIAQKTDGTVDYNITLREDLVFSDGTPLTIDDVIFSLYVYSDPTYDGYVTFNSLPVSGMNNFRTGLETEVYDKYVKIANGIHAAGPDNTDFSNWTQAQQSAFWGEYLYGIRVPFVQAIVDFCVENYGDTIYSEMVFNNEIALGMFAWGFGDFNDDDIFYGAYSGTEFDLENGVEPTLDDFWSEILIAYDNDLRGIDAESADGSGIFDPVLTAFISGEGAKDPAAGGEIKNISGIKKTGQYSCTVTTDHFEATSIYQFAIPIAPMHYYGDKSQYSYEKNMFGFPKGDLSIVRDKTTEPLGAGRYKFLSFESGVVSFEANENYYQGEPKIKYLRLQTVTDADKLAGIIAGNIDVTDPAFSSDVVEAIKKYNSNSGLSGDRITTSTVDYLGYGYIGISAGTVNVGGDPGSQASKYLRAAFATLFAAYRDIATNSYFGETASTIQYPISNTSWAAPRPNDEGYRVAYSKDVDGKDIYSDSMSEQDKYSAALDAAIGFFKAAGYVWNDASGRFTTAPAGAYMAYEVIIAAGGSGNHPAYSILTAAKEALGTIGIALEINDPADGNVLWTAIESGEAEIWVAAWQVTLDPDMYQVYHSSNIVGRGGTDSNSYAVDDALLDELILEARKSDNQAYRKATYRQCLEIIMDWAVEVPNYQRKNAVVFSTERVKIETITPDITTFWNWMNDLELLEMN